MVSYNKYAVSIVKYYFVYNFMGRQNWNLIKNNLVGCYLLFYGALGKPIPNWCGSSEIKVVRAEMGILLSGEGLTSVYRIKFPQLSQYYWKAFNIIYSDVFLPSTSFKAN